MKSNLVRIFWLFHSVYSLWILLHGASLVFYSQKTSICVNFVIWSKTVWTSSRSPVEPRISSICEFCWHVQKSKSLRRSTRKNKINVTLSSFRSVRCIPVPVWLDVDAHCQRTFQSSTCRPFLFSLSIKQKFKDSRDIILGIGIPALWKNAYGMKLQCIPNDSQDKLQWQYHASLLTTKSSMLAISSEIRWSGSISECLRDEDETNKDDGQEIWVIASTVNTPSASMALPIVIIHI
jgi:hypothetical protein